MLLVCEVLQQGVDQRALHSVNPTRRELRRPFDELWDETGILRR